MNKSLAKTMWQIEHIRDGQVISKQVVENLVTNEGLSYLLNAIVKGGTQISSWYLALFEDNHTPLAGDTYAVPGYTEVNAAIDEATRPAWTSGAVTTTHILELTFTAGNAVISIGDMIEGATSAATAFVVDVNVTAGSWAGGDAAGTIRIKDKTGTFQAENINIVGGTAAAVTVAGASTGLYTVTNTSSKATFTFNAAKTIYGGGLVGGGTGASTKADAAGGGTLYCSSTFSPVPVANTDVLKVEISLVAVDY